MEWASVAALEGHAPIALTGSGRCFLPGHPRSESPISSDPPVGGESRTISWMAERP